MAWPTPQDYNEAVQTPSLCFSDPDLKAGEPELTPLGLPRAQSGNFASVYRVRSGRSDLAVRCFLRELPDLQERYQAISDQLARRKLGSMADFTYLERGIRLQGRWYPILKMEWLQGQTLDLYLAENRHDSGRMRALADQWVTLMADLKRRQIAHGDLQHGNILVVGGRLRLIDYDGMWVPALAGRQSHELGHRNYQHPGRTVADFGDHIDHYSAWVIYLTLLALTANPRLWTQFQAGDQRLLLGEADLTAPERSPVLRAMEQAGDGRLRELVGWFRRMTALELRQVPPLSQAVALPVQAGAGATGGLGPGSSGAGGAGSSSPGPGGAPGAFGGPGMGPGASPATQDWWRAHLRPGAPTGPASFGVGPAVAAPGAPTATPDWVQSHQVAAAPPVAAAPTVAVAPLRRFGASLWPERAGLALITLGAGAGVWGIQVAGLPLWPPAAAVGGGLLLWLAAAYHRFGSQPELIARQGAQERLEKASEALRRTQLLLADQQERLTTLARSEAAERALLEQRLQEIQAQAQLQREKIDRESRERLDYLSSRRDGVIAAEAGEMKEALHRLQQRYLADQLARHPITETAIPGIGPAIVDRLVRGGLHTAADLAGVNLTALPGAPGDSVLLELASGQRIQIEGIGTQRAAALLRWRRSLEYWYAGSQPYTLPLGDYNAIHSRWAMQRSYLEQQMAAIRVEADGRLQAVALLQQSEEAPVLREITDLRRRFGASRVEAERELLLRQQALATAEREQRTARAEAERHGAISFPGYLRQVLAG